LGDANWIRELRERSGLTLDALAAKVGTTNQQISHLELGKRRLTIDWLVRIAAALNCHPWLLVASDDTVATTEREHELLTLFRSLDRRHQDAALGYLGLIEVTPIDQAT